MTRITAGRVRRHVQAPFLLGQRRQRMVTVMHLRPRGMVDDRALSLLQFAHRPVSRPPSLYRTNGPDSESPRPTHPLPAHPSAVIEGHVSTGPRLPPRSLCQARLPSWQAHPSPALSLSPCQCPSLEPPTTHSGMAVYPPPSSLVLAIHTTLTRRPAQPRTRQLPRTAGTLAPV